jgi:cytochrome P450
VRVGPDEVSFTSAAAWDDMQGRRGSRSAEFERDPNFFIVTQIDQRDSLLSPVKEEHNMIRRMMLPAFADRAMVRQEAILLEWADRFLQSLHRRKGESIDIAETYHWTTFDMMGDLAFGESFGCLENDRTHYFLDLVTKALPYLSVLHILLRFDMTRLLYTTATRLPWMQSWMDTLDFAADVAEKRFQRRGEAREDIMTIIWDNAQERKEKLSRRQAAQLANILCTVGTETTSTALAGITYWLLKTPHAYAALATELRSLTEDELTIRKLAVLPYLNACVTEGMRKHTAVAGPTPRVSPKGGAWVDGYFIPEGVS